MPSGGALVCRLLSAPRELLPPQGIQCAHRPERTVPLRSATPAASWPEDHLGDPCLGRRRPFAPFLTPPFSQASALPSLAALPPKHRRHLSRLSTSCCWRSPGCALVNLQFSGAVSRSDPQVAELSPGAQRGRRSPVWHSVLRSPGAARPASFCLDRRGPAASRRAAGRPFLRIPGLGPSASRDWVPPHPGTGPSASRDWVPPAPGTGPSTSRDLVPPYPGTGPSASRDWVPPHPGTGPSGSLVSVRLSRGSPVGSRVPEHRVCLLFIPIAWRWRG